MRITVCGAAGEVTGSAYLVETSRARVLVDFGMFQGRRATEERNRDLGPVDPAALDAIVATHAHLDHTGRLPLLALHGLKCPIYATAATGDFAELILRDSAHIQESDAQRNSRRAQRAGRDPVQPLYTLDDVEKLDALFREVPYNQPTQIAPGVTIRLVDAGHILGSSSMEMRLEDGEKKRTVVFSGDIGPRDVPFLRNPVLLEQADLVFLESTYGGREHRSLDDTVAEFHDILEGALHRRAKVLIPTFAIGRAQQILFHLAEMIRHSELPEFPIYLDSPMAIKATELYWKHQDLFDKEATALIKDRAFRRDLQNLEFLPTAQDSMRLNRDTQPGVILAGAGMCNGGRILHHFKNHLWRKNTRVLFVGFQSPGTLGRQLVDGAKYVRVYGERIRVRATIHTLGGFSAHAGARQLVEWVKPLVEGGARVALTHGEDDSRDALSARLKAAYGIKAAHPKLGSIIQI